MIARSITAEQFIDQKFELTDGGRWAELIAGEVVVYDPPSGAHGNAVLNLSRAIAEWIDTTRVGYACFELGLIIRRTPDSILCPAISYFSTGDRWAETDKVATESRPRCVFEVASTSDRVRGLHERVQCYREFGIAVVCAIEVAEKKVTVYTSDGESTVIRDGQALASNETWLGGSDEDPVLPGFSIPLKAIFADPEWWSGPRRNKPSAE